MARLSVLPLVLLALLALAPVAQSQSPHFTSCTATTTTGGDLAFVGQIAGLGNQMRPPTPLRLEASALAVCLDATTTPPTVLGTTPVADSVTFPPKNGNRRYAFVLDTPFVLPCDPPAEVVFVLAQVCDVTHGICCPEPELEPEPEPEPE